MAGYKIQLKDKNGNRQYPVTTTNVVVDADGVSVADLLDRKQPTLVSGVNIKTINGKTLLGEGDLVIEGGNGDSSASVETRVLYVYLEGAELTEEEKTYNKETYDKIANGENVQLVFDVLGIPVTHAFYDGGILFTCSVVVIEGSALYAQGRLFSDGNYEYEEGVIGSNSYPIYYSYDGTPLTEEQKAANKMAIDKYVADESVVLYPYSSVGHPFEVVLTLSEGIWKMAELTNYIFASFNDDGTAMYYVKVTVNQDGDVQVEFSAESPLVLASKAYVDSKVGGGTLGDNVITLYVPAIDEATEEVLTYDDCIAEIENNFGEDDVEIPQLVKDAVSAFFVSMKQHNAAEYARAKQMAEDGEEVSIMLKGYEYPLLVLALYLLEISLGNEPTLTPEEFVEQFNAMTSVDDMIFPKGYTAGYLDGTFGMEVTYERYVLAPNEDGEWAISAIKDARRTASLYYEGDARLDADKCENNLHVKDIYLNDCDFDVLEYTGNHTSTHHDVLIIGKTTKTVSDFVNLNGDVVTCGVTAFQYIEDTQLIELQVSNEDGYCRRVVLGKVNVGENGGGGNITETDPVFKASPAAAITQADITRWNSNTGGGGSVTVDSAMSETSTNPVQNKVITKAISDIEERVSNMEDFFGEGANLTLSIKSNQGTDETISAVKATIKYDGQSMESGSGIIGLPAFTSIQIIFPDIEGYKTPAPISFDTNGHPISYSVTYETEVVNVNLSAWDGASVNGQIVTINGKSYTWDGNDIQHKVAFGVEYWVYANDKSGYVIKGDKFVASQTNRTVSLVYNGVAGSFITIDQNIADSATRVSGDINGEHIQLIRNNSHRYLGKYTSDGTMTLCQLDDDDSHYYSDGSEAVLTGSQGDVFMKLPRFFYTVNERRPDVWSIGFYYGNSAPSSAWVEWDGNELIGVFKLSSSARSIAYDSSYGLSKDTYSSRAAARGNGYSLIKWKHHGIMAVLYFALYGNTNSQAVIGAGLGAGNRQCGSTSSLGMTDTVASETAINFWGLENWWGAGYEFFENVTFFYDTWTWKIVEDDGTIRERKARTYSSYLGKCYIDTYLDFGIERPDSTATYSATTGYCDEVSHYMSSANERVMERGANVTGYMGILAMHTIIDSSTATNGNYEGGSRICFRGTIIINNDSTAFKALTAIN